MKRFFRTAALALMLAGAMWPASTWAASCTVSVTAMSFGNYDVFATSPLSSTATIAYRCQPGIPVNPPILTADPGNGTFANRYMLQGSSQLLYNLYVDPAGSAIFGNGAGGTASITGVLISNARLNGDNVIYGRIPAGQDVGPGLYTDSVVVTINF